MTPNPILFGTIFAPWLVRKKSMIFLPIALALGIAFAHI
jgi:hypothetical protein